MSQSLTLDQVKEIKERLRELKEEWISTKPGRGRSQVQYIDKDTVVQILEYATHGITTWDFEIVEQWKEEVYKNFAQKGQAPQWGFDGYVYHVKGKLTIHGLGSRMQYGKKVAEGGANNQDSAYQAAASTCLNKCASMFGVGEKLYVKNQIQNKEEWYEQTMQQYDPQGYQQMMNEQQQYQNSYAGPNGGTLYLQDQMNGFQNQNQQWGQGNQQQWGNQGFNQQQEVNPWQGVNQNANNQKPASNPNEDINWQQMSKEINEAMNMGAIEFPFDVPENNTFQAQPQGQAETQGQVQEQNFQAKQMGAPVINEQAQQTEQTQSAVAVAERPQGSDQQQLFMEQVNTYNQHRSRLGIQNDDGMLPYLRDYFQDEKADTSFLNMETIKGFNEYMNNIQG